MSRAKIWGFTLLVLAAGAAGVYVISQRASERALEQAGATLKAGVAQFETATRVLARQVSAVTVLAARDPALLAVAEAAAPSRPGARRAPATTGADVVAAAEAALRSAAQALDVDPTRALVAASGPGAVAFQAGERRLSGTEAVVPSVLGEFAGARFVRVDDTVYQLASTPVASGVTVAFGLPVDPRFLERVKGATGADVTLTAGAKMPSTMPPSEVAGVVAAARKGGGSPVDVGSVGPVRLPVAGAPGMSILFTRAPAWRARTLALAGLDASPAVVSVSTRPLLEPVGVLQQVALAALALLFLVGLVLGALPERALTAHVPLELASAADRIARGDFEARVPRMSGTFGSVAAALNRAAEAAARAGRGGAPAPSPAPVPALTLDVPLIAVPPLEAAAVAEDPFARGGMAAPGPSLATAPQPLGLGPRNGSDRSHLTPLPTMPAQRTGTARFEAAEPLAPQVPVRAPAAVAVPAPPPAPVADEDQWQGVFQEFLRVREQCGESLDGLTWDRFRQKLQKNKDSLVQKYACRTVRFQVYVKEGKAALKATPVR
jgi:hypothetical protein